MKKLIDYLVLPNVVSAFEASYLARLNRIGFVFFALHLPLFVGLAYFNDTGPLAAAVLTAFVLAGPLLALKVLANPRSVSLVYGFTAMIMGGLLVHFGQGPVQIEMHFYFFALLAMLAVFGNPLAIVVAAVTVALHHLLRKLGATASDGGEAVIDSGFSQSTHARHFLSDRVEFFRERFDCMFGHA